MVDDQKKNKSSVYKSYPATLLTTTLKKKKQITVALDPSIEIKKMVPIHTYTAYTYDIHNDENLFVDTLYVQISVVIKYHVNTMSCITFLTK